MFEQFTADRQGERYGFYLSLIVDWKLCLPTKVLLSNFYQVPLNLARCFPTQVFSTPVI